MATPYRQIQRRVHWQPRGEELKYLRRDGNRMVRARRRRRTALRMSLQVVAWVAAAGALGTGALMAARWSMSPGHFQLTSVAVKGTSEALDAEILDLVKDQMGQNILTLDLTGMEKKVRQHPWIGSSGSVRVQRRLPGSVVITLAERAAGGLASMDGTVWLLDVNGMPIDRFGPRFARYDFPIIKGIDAMKPPAGGDGSRLAKALARGVAVTRALEGRDPGFSAEVSEIDISDPDMVVLRLEDEEYDLRISPDDFQRNLDNYLAIRDRIKSGEEDGGTLEYVDLRWKDRVAVMPAADGARKVDKNGGR